MKKQTVVSSFSRITVVLFIALYDAVTSNAQMSDFYGNAVSSDVCNQRQFNSDKEVERLVTRILGLYNVDNSYTVSACIRIDNCVATKDDKGRPYLLYNPDFLKKIKVFSFIRSDIPTKTEDWEVMLVLAHEIGHHLNNHDTNPHPDLTSRDMELKADETAGFLLYLLNAPDLLTAQKGLRVPQMPEDGSYTHPPRRYRLEAFKKGWDKAAERFPRLPTIVSGSGEESKSRCGAFVAPDEWKAFMCHNLGSANTMADPFTPSWEIIGGYWQWGRKEMAAHGPSGPDSSQVNGSEITGWGFGTESASNGSWSDKIKTVNDPCPSGFRVPTKNQWDGILKNNNLSRLGTWNQLSENNNSGLKIGDKLFLPAAGYRKYYSGKLNDRGIFGYYWSSAEDDIILGFGSQSSFTGGSSRNSGYSVRCIAE
jgi:uncharacterized protein (TIGR02145 family)